MEADSGMDVAWCLTCSKRTRDARNTYCSDACREADSGATPSSSKIPITSPVPPALYPSSSVKSLDRRRSSASPTKPSAPRPPLATRAATFLPPASEADFAPVIPAGAPRDRRAFSFPSAPNSPPMLFPLREHRKSTVLPAFARREIVANMTPKSPGLTSVKEDGRRYKDILAKRLARSTGGANTPGTAPESVFLSTSESSDGEDDEPIKPVGITPPLLPVRAVSGGSATAQVSTLRSHLSLGRTNSLQTRSTSTSPVAAMVASSASSRSREDIISWARSINRRDGDEAEDDKPRGRPRTKRISSLAWLPPPSTEPLDDHVEEDEVVNDAGSTGLGTTPKGRIGSALAGLSGYGMGSIVKALTSVTSPSRPPALRKTTTPGRPGSSTADFAVTPSPAEVAKVAVVASTMPYDDGPSYMGGGTATLSTVSFSEAIDPSVVGTHDHVDIVTDDGAMSASSSNFARRSNGRAKLSSRKGSIGAVPPPLPERQNALVRPAASTTSALWNLSSYFTRFAPFAISSVISPYATAPIPPRTSQPPSQMSTVPTTVTSTALTSPEAEPAEPLPALRSRPDSPDSPAQQLVRSVPMDIAIPACSVSPEDVDIQANAHRSCVDRDRLRSSRSRARSRSRRRSRSRSSSAGRVLDRETRNEDLGKGVGMSNQGPDADADVSDEEGVADRRRRGRERGRGREVGDEKERGRGRGRDRSVKVI
ncbi:uncharacterized protein MKK02DRAFT_33226 [Dioszegia hungarica]|uniref:Uncharacterized protein n=1 Tax=Dioszegia hungarica TaxID=4972 RepID=A0AA38H8K0_9TREE|nr:uncharacterized protein MKK02DRAFT_33226 [Dioszegia hungarica]KAI9635913.1 hypothetical protein MKK02DRAFT_33226 [Dioszegia hungarica]